MLKREWKNEMKAKFNKKSMLWNLFGNSIDKSCFIGNGCWHQENNKHDWFILFDILYTLTLLLTRMEFNL